MHQLGTGTGGIRTHKSDRISTNIYNIFAQGEITIELYTEHAPKTCKNFYELVTTTQILNTHWSITLDNGVVFRAANPMASTVLILIRHKNRQGKDTTTG